MMKTSKYKKIYVPYGKHQDVIIGKTHKDIGIITELLQKVSTAEVMQSDEMEFSKSIKNN